MKPTRPIAAARRLCTGRPGPDLRILALTIVLAVAGLAGPGAAGRSLAQVEGTTAQPLENAAGPADSSAAGPSHGEAPDSLAQPTPERSSVPPNVVLRAMDAPDDGGRAIRLEWDTSAHLPEDATFEIERATQSAGPFEIVGSATLAAGEFVDQPIERGVEYFYRVAGLPGAPAVSGVGRAQWFAFDLFPLFVIIVIFLGLILFYVHRAKAGKGLFIRRIPGLDAMEEAVGRATEMGKPVLYVPGIDDANNIQTIYSMVILNNIAKMVAQYDTELIVPICKAFVVPLAEETVKGGYMDVGRPDSYNPDNVRFLSDEQFAFTAAVNGIMLRERPAANIFLGSFFAESLMLAETGFMTGAIQIAGTANIHQLPFFVVACDYTMIGEEFFATSAYLSREPMLVGTLKGSDAMKLLIMIFLVVGAILETSGIHLFTELLVLR